MWQCWRGMTSSTSVLNGCPLMAGIKNNILKTCKDQNQWKKVWGPNQNSLTLLGLKSSLKKTWERKQFPIDKFYVILNKGVYEFGSIWWTWKSESNKIIGSDFFGVRNRTKLDDNWFDSWVQKFWNRIDYNI